MNKSEYSKKQITTALIEMLQTASLEQITITSLVSKAKVSRNAFYNNYHSIEDILKEVYQQAHQNTFQNKYHDIHYFTSDEAIQDFITFFDKNTQLLLALNKWDLLPYISKYNTEAVLQSLNQENQFIQDHKEYFMIYYTISYFNICYYWILSGKKESASELFQIIKTIQNYA